MFRTHEIPKLPKILQQRQQLHPQTDLLNRKTFAIVAATTEKSSLQNHTDLIKPRLRQQPHEYLKSSQ
jgi:hypothetical protein